MPDALTTSEEGCQEEKDKGASFGGGARVPRGGRYKLDGGDQVGWVPGTSGLAELHICFSFRKAVWGRLDFKVLRRFIWSDLPPRVFAEASLNMKWVLDLDPAG